MHLTFYVRALDSNPQVAKNALLTLADLWRGLGDTLDPELPMVCPLLVKKLGDKVEFLAEAAREVSGRKAVVDGEMPEVLCPYRCLKRWLWGNYCFRSPCTGRVNKFRVFGLVV